jgi:GTP-binding protein EngB required for normal cell division
MLNALLNYCLGVQFSDNVRYRFNNSEEWSVKRGGDSVTSKVTEYHIEATDRNPPLILVDSPGFGDTRGVGYDQKTAAAIKDHFHNKLQRIDALCFVCNSSLERLNSTQEYIIAMMTDIFGDKAAKCISVLATFCDGGAVNVKSALEVSPSFQKVLSKLPKSHVFEFNNSSLYVDPTADPSNVNNKNFWNMSMKGTKNFIDERIRGSESTILNKSTRDDAYVEESGDEKFEVIDYTPLKKTMTSKNVDSSSERVHF